MKTKTKTPRNKKTKTNYVNVALVAITVLALAYAFSSGQSNQPTENEPRLTTTMPALAYDCDPVCITSGMWDAKNLGHDTGHLAVDGNWESDAGGFGYLIAGQNIPLKAGRYQVIFEMRVDNNSKEENTVFIEASKNRGDTMLGRDILANEFSRPNVFQNFTLQLVAENDLQDVEFRAHYNKRNCIIGISRVYLIPTA